MTTSTSPQHFADKIAVVSGGSSGIGAAVADQLHTEGATVEIADVAATGAAHVDLADPAQIAAYADYIARAHGRCDVLINSAGILAAGIATDCTEADWDRVQTVNVRGTWLMSRHLLPLMPNGAAIVNVSSGAGLRAIATMVAYVASKHAVVGLTRAMAVDHAEQGVRVNCICPGVVDTPLAVSAQELRPAHIAATVESFDDRLIKRKGTPAEIASAICFLSSPGAAYITGTTLAVDGGRTQH